MGCIMAIYSYFTGTRIKGMSRSQAYDLFSFRRVVFAAILSFALQLFGFLALNSFFSFTATGRKPDVLWPQAQKTENKLNMLREEKKQLIQETLLGLQGKAKKTPMSRFFRKSQVLDYNIRALEEGSFDLVNGNDVADLYHDTLKQAKRWAAEFKSDRDKIAALHLFSHQNIFQWYLKTSGDFFYSLGATYDDNAGTYNCKSSTELQTALEDDIIGSKNYGVVVLDPAEGGKKGGHLLSWFEDDKGVWEIENTDGSFPRLTPFRMGLRAPKDIFKAAYLARNGVSVSQLPGELAGLYSRGVRPDGFPVAGAKTDLPEPPEGKILNPYYKMPDPVPDDDDLKKKKYKKILRTQNIIKEALVWAMMRNFHFSDADGTSLSLIRVPEGIDWCRRTKEWDQRESLGRYEDRFYEEINYWRYLYQVRAADLLYAAGKEKYAECTTETELKKFEQTAKAVLAGVY